MSRSPVALVVTALVLVCAASVTAGGRTGTRIAFVSADHEDIHLYLANQDGTGARRMTNFAGSDLFPKWSPVDARIAISARGPHQSQPDIWVVDTKRGSLLRLTRTRDRELQPTWSPSGRRIAFVGKSYDLYVIRSTGHVATRLTHTNVCEVDPAWSPNGQWIAYTRRCEAPQFVYLLDLRTGSRTRFSKTQGQGPAWSPDGTQIAFRSGNEIRIKNISTAYERVLVTVPNLTGHLSWSPDGSKLLLDAATSVGCELPEDIVRQLFVYDIPTSELRRLPISSCFPEFEGDWERHR